MTIYNGKGGKSGYRVDKSDMKELFFMHDVYLGALINRLGGEVEFTEEELNQVQHLDLYRRDPNKEDIFKIQVNRIPEGNAGDVVNKIYIASDHKHKVCFWSFWNEEGAREAHVFAPDNLTREDKTAFINACLESITKDTCKYVESKPQYRLLKSLHAEGKLRSWELDTLKSLEREYSAQLSEKPGKSDLPSSIFEKLTNKVFVMCSRVLNIVQTNKR